MQIEADARVFAPMSLNDALAILKQHSDIVVFAGGSEIQTRSAGETRLSGDILALGNIEELQRIYRSDRMLEIGCMVSLERLTRFDAEVIPKGLRELLLSIPHPEVRSIASIGGNIMVHQRYLSSYYYLSLCDSRAELRRQGNSRWIPVSKLRSGETPGSPEAELLTRVRIPLKSWNHQNYRQFFSRESGIDYAICALASVHQNIVEDLRIAYLFSDNAMIRNQYADSMLIGRRLPASDKEVGSYLEEVQRNWKEQESWEKSDELIKNRLLNLSAWFIHNLDKS